MRGRRRSGEWAAQDRHLREDAIDALTDKQCAEALRALARLLARQAAREIFERESADARADQPSSEDLR